MKDSVQMLSKIRQKLDSLNYEEKQEVFQKQKDALRQMGLEGADYELAVKESARLIGLN